MCQHLELTLSRKQAKHMVDMLKSGQITVGQLPWKVAELGQRLIDELEDKITLQIDTKHSELFENAKAFGDAVFAAFPSKDDGSHSRRREGQGEGCKNTGRYGHVFV